MGGGFYSALWRLGRPYTLKAKPSSATNRLRIQILTRGTTRYISYARLRVCARLISHAPTLSQRSEAIQNVPLNLSPQAISMTTYKGKSGEIFENSLSDWNA